MPTCYRCQEVQLVRGKRSNLEGICKYCARNLGNTVTQNNKRARRAKTFGRLRTVDWYRVLASHDFCCASCGVRHGHPLQQGPKRNRVAYLTLDHQHPISRGGLNTVHNIIPLCQVCHAVKDGDPDVMPWDKEEVEERRDRRRRGQAFFHHLMRNVLQVRAETFCSALKVEWEEAVASGEEDYTFGEYMTERLLVEYVDRVRSGSLKVKKRS